MIATSKIGLVWQNLRSGETDCLSFPHVQSAMLDLQGYQQNNVHANNS